MNIVSVGLPWIQRFDAAGCYCFNQSTENDLINDECMNEIQRILIQTQNSGQDNSISVDRYMYAISIDDDATTDGAVFVDR